MKDVKLQDIRDKLDFATWVDHILNDNKQNTPPVNVFNIAQNENIELGYLSKRKVQHERIEGKCYFHNRNKHWVIRYNKENSLTRQRITVAHELGHYFLHKTSFEDTDEVLFRNIQWNLYELQANQFAAELLMPKIMIIKYGESIADRSKSKPHFVKLMSETFMVSKKAMQYRLYNMGLTDL